jgi:hypothetical protein
VSGCPVSDRDWMRARAARSGQIGTFALSRPD